MESLSDWLIGLFGTWTTVAQAAVIFLAIIVVIGVAIMTNLKWGKIIVTGRDRDEGGDLTGRRRPDALLDAAGVECHGVPFLGVWV